jgi:hypothetical protein
MMENEERKPGSGVPQSKFPQSKGGGRNEEPEEEAFQHQLADYAWL